MKFELSELEKSIINGDYDKILSLAYKYQCNVTYIKEEEYGDLNNLLKFIISQVYNINQEDVKEELFDVVKKALNLHFSKYKKFEEIIDIVIDKIESNNITFSELAESLLIISYTMDKKYMDIMTKYSNYENKLIRDISQEYLTDMICQN